MLEIACSAEARTTGLAWKATPGGGVQHGQVVGAVADGDGLLQVDVLHHGQVLRISAFFGRR